MFQVKGDVPTEDRVTQHLVLVRRLAQQGVGDGAVGVREAGQVRSGCQGVYCQGMSPRAWRTHKTFTTTFWESESSVQDTHFKTVHHTATHAAHAQGQSPWQQTLANFSSSNGTGYFLPSHPHFCLHSDY